MSSPEAVRPPHKNYFTGMTLKCQLGIRPDFYYVLKQVTRLVTGKSCLYSRHMTMREGDTVTASGEPTEFVGYGPASEYLGLARNTLSSYVARGIGPTASESRADGQYNLPVFTKAELDRWKANRPGQGARTDLASAVA